MVPVLVMAMVAEESASARPPDCSSILGWPAVKNVRAIAASVSSGTTILNWAWWLAAIKPRRFAHHRHVAFQFAPAAAGQEEHGGGLRGLASEIPGAALAG